MRRNPLGLDEPVKRRRRAVGTVSSEPVGPETKSLGGALDHGSGCAHLGLPDRARRFDIEDDRGLQVDQIVICISEERVSFVSAGPLRCRIGPGDELRRDLAGRTPGGLVESVEILPYGTPARSERRPICTFCAGDGPLLVGVGRDQTGIDRKSLPANEPFLDTTAHHSLEDMPERIAVTKSTMAVLRDSRVIRYPAVQAEPTEPAVG